MPKTLTPMDLGFPSKFTKFLPDQLETAQAIDQSTERIQVLDAPTGRGKTAIYMTVACLRKQRTLILTGTRRLQDQICEFDTIGLADVRGMGNYRCVALSPNGQYYNGPNEEFGIWRCSDGPCLSNAPCALKSTRDCHFHARVLGAKDSQVVSTNYAFQLSRPADYLGEFDLVICDEAHTLLDWITKSTTCTFDQVDIKQHLGLDIPMTNNVSLLSTWAKIIALDRCRDALKLAERDRDWGLAKDLLSLQKQLHRLTHSHVEWIATIDDTVITIQPITVGHFLEKAFCNAPKVILSSATITGADMASLGISEYTTHSLRSTFPVASRPVLYLDSPPYISLNYRSPITHYQIMANVIHRVCAALPVKTVIHTVSYHLASTIYDLLPNRSRFLVDTRTCDMIDKYLTERHPWVLLTPKLREGADLKYDLCRLQVIVKIPYPNFGDALTLARRDRNRNYTNNLTARAITQSAGRGMRVDDDWCITIVLDSNWKRWARPQYFAPWFCDSIGTLDSIDQLSGLVP